MLAAAVFAVVGLLSCPPKSVLFGFAGITSIVLIITVVGAGVLPDIRTEDSKLHTPRSLYSDHPGYLHHAAAHRHGEDRPPRAPGAGGRGTQLRSAHAAFGTGRGRDRRCVRNGPVDA